MPSTLTWLDASHEEQRRMRDIVNLFTQKDSREELGIGTMRDALSDMLFPGTSTLLTRARYLFFIPWCYQFGAMHATDAEGGRRVGERAERDLISTLIGEHETDGLLGQRVGSALRMLPSTLYWGTMRRYGILAPGSTTLNAAVTADIERRHRDPESDTELGGWLPSLPPVPRDFPKTSAGGFELTLPEAELLAHRIRLGAEGSLLAHLVDDRPGDNRAPWLDPASHRAPESVQAGLEQARLFSFAVHGAALLYNFELAKAYTEAGYTRIDVSVDTYEARYERWLADVPKSGLDAWDIEDFFALVLRENPRISTRSRMFLRDWVGLTLQGDQQRAADRVRLHERQHKQGQSRFRNPKLLEVWGGASGDGEIVFRWSQVRRVLADIHHGLARTDARTD